MNSKKDSKKQGGKKNSGSKETSTKGVFFWLTLVGILTFLAYLPILGNGFVNWDETTYIVNNLMIRSFDLKNIFSSFQLGNYHPLTMLVYTIEYHIFGLNEMGYHAISLLLHLSNVFLVFYFLRLLCRRSDIALIAAFLFGIHPIHVESVAWAAELKDLLYTFFFLGSLINYISYIRDEGRKYFFFSILFFILSILSKAMAVSLFPVLFLIDYYDRRKFNTKILLEKIPYFILSVVFGIVAIFAQSSTNSFQEISIYPFHQRILFACYSFVNYLFKLIIPENLSAYYLYPMKSGMDIPGYLYLYVLILIVVAGLLFLTARKNKTILFGMGFFTATVALVLQLIPVGDAVMADRYAYIPSIGFLFIAGEGIMLLSKRYKTLSYVILSAFGIFFFVQTYQRCKVWKDPVTLWTDVINHDGRIAVAYNNRGGILMNNGKNEAALNDFNKAISIRPDYADALNNRGVLFYQTNKFENALSDFDATIKVKPMHEAFNNRGLVFMNLNRMPEARRDFDKAIELDGGYAQAYYNRGLLSANENKNEDAIKDYSRAIQIDPKYVNPYANRGVVYQKEKKYDEALRDYEMTLVLQPGNPQALFNTGLIQMTQKKFDEAISSFSKALESGTNNAKIYYNRGMAKYFSGKIAEACVDFNAASKLGHSQAEEAIAQYCR